MPTAVATTTCNSDSIPDNTAPDPSDSWWHFVVPSTENWLFTGSGFTASFTGGSVESITFVQARTGGFMGVVVEADGGATLTNAFVTDAGTNEPSETEGTGSEGDDFVLSNSCGGDATTTTSATTTTTTTKPTTTTDKTTSTTSTTATVSTTLTSPTTTTKTSTVTTSVPTTTTVTTGTTSTSTVTTTVPTTVTTVTTSTGTVTTTLTKSTTLTVVTTLTAPTTVTTTKSVTVSVPASTISSSTSSSTPTSSVQGASTPSTGSGSDVEFGIGLVLLVGGGGLIAGATRITRRKKS